METTNLTIQRPGAKLRRPDRRWPLAILRPMILLASDASALGAALAVAFLVKGYNDGGIAFAPYLKLWPFTFVFLASYWMSGLYSWPALSQPEELERGTACSSCIFLSLSAFTMAMRGGIHYATVTLATAILANAILMPLFREVSRHLFSKLPGWGYQAIILGAGFEARALIERSKSEREAGISAVAVLDPIPQAEPFLCGLPITSSIQAAAGFLDPSRPAYGLLTVAAASSAEIVRLLHSPESLIFSRVVLISNPSAMSSMWAMPLSRRHTAGLTRRSPVNGLTYCVAKRALDLGLSTVFLLCCLPFMALIALCIKLDSAGPALFGHERLGKNAKAFKAWKFRTMHTNGSAILEAWFAEHASAKEEWARSNKLEHDPRITRIGRFLRVTSLDELPQLWNVLRGDMSLVGPRPIVEEEVCRYGDDYEVFSRAQGGVTGMWQVSGRSSTTYNERVMLDSFYVENWSIWLDLTIILRTFGAVLLRKGAV
jgi:Undecaprenyl-phosphate galactose phosphotransferase WbaP